ncbi:MAG: Ig-like domain-containing protein [Candidatus Krumholzibacteria bacterium]|nr:Ig-like domain-containing protein [Candidatus Krumholzibacteria bacterium]
MAFLAATALIAACAVREPPPGGPEDKTPPSVVMTLPAADSAGVSRDLDPVLFFSEKVDPASFKNRVFIYPPVEFEHLKVKGERLEIDFKGLLPETTMCLLVRSGIKDYHGISSKQNYLLYFSTADSLAKGEISGIILFKDKPDSTGVAELFAIKGDTTLTLGAMNRSRVAFADAHGEFILRAVPTDGSKWLLRVFKDPDGDARYSEGKEFCALYPDTIVLRPLHESVTDIRLTIIDPNEPGSITGLLANETGFAIAPMIRLQPAKPGAKAKTITARPDSTGAYTLARVPPGEYLFSAFIDIKVDTLCGTYPDPQDTTRTLSEPCIALPDTLKLKPGEEKKLEPMTLK